MNRIEQTYLAQIGELNFILAATGLYTGITGEFGYQAAVLVISLTLLVSPFWIGLTKKLTHWSKKKSIKARGNGGCLISHDATFTTEYLPPRTLWTQRKFSL